MTIRSDVTVDWDASPRIITVASGSNNIQIQDLIDTCMYLCALPANMDDAILLESSGKEYLTADGSVKVGLTVTLNNAQIAFEARPGPEWVLCSIDGGNVVAVTDIYTTPRSYIDPRKPTAYVSVDRTSSSSATLIEQEAIQYSSYQNAVWFDVSSSNTGTDYPVGTREYPVNNLTNAVAIANDRGFDTIQVLTSTILDSGTDFRGFKIRGKSRTSTNIYIAPDALCEGISVFDCTVSGVLDGGSTIEDCVVGNLTYVNGHIHDCGLVGTISLAGNSDAILNDCSAVSHTSMPTIDLGGIGQSATVSNYSGAIKFKNVNYGSTTRVSLGLDTGYAFLDTTVSGGYFTISGLGSLLNLSGGTAYVSDEGLISKDAISVAVWDEDIGDHLIAGTTGFSVGISQFGDYVHINALTGVSGTTFPIGTHLSPVNNINDAVSIAALRGFNKLHIHGDFTFTDDISIAGYSIYGDGKQSSTFTFVDGCQLLGCFVYNAKMTGNDIGIAGTENVWMYNMSPSSSASGDKDAILKNVVFEGESVLASNWTGTLQVLDSWGRTTVSGEPFTVNINNGATSADYSNWAGYIKFTNNSTDVDISVSLLAGGVIIDSTVVSGTFNITGVGTLEDNSGPGVTVNSYGLMSKETITDVTWEIIHLHTESTYSGTTFPVGTRSQPVNNIVDARAIADEHGLWTFHCRGNIVLDQDYENWVFITDSPDVCTIDLNDKSVANSSFRNFDIVGNGVGYFTAYNCQILSGMTGFQGNMQQTQLGGNFTIAAGEQVNGDSASTVANVNIDMNGTGTFTMANFSGVLTVSNINSPTSLLGITGYYLLTITDTCVLGQALIAGTGILTDNSGTNFYIIERTLPQDVWTETTATTLTGDMSRALGLMQENQYIDNTVYDVNGNMTSGRLRTYSVAGSVGTSSDVIATYNITATWSGNEMTSYKVVKA